MREDFDPCAERETYDYSLMVNAELESQLEYVSDQVLAEIVEAYRRELIGE